MARIMTPNYDDFRRDFRAYGDEVLRKKKEYQMAMEGSFGERAAAEKEIKGTFSQNAELNKQIHGTFGDRSLLDQWKANLMAGVENRRTAVAEGKLAQDKPLIDAQVASAKRVGGFANVAQQTELAGIQDKNADTIATLENDINTLGTRQKDLRKGLMSSAGANAVGRTPGVMSWANPWSEFFIGRGLSKVSRLGNEAYKRAEAAEARGYTAMPPEAEDAAVKELLSTSGTIRTKTGSLGRQRGLQATVNGAATPTEATVTNAARLGIPAIRPDVASPVRSSGFDIPEEKKPRLINGVWTNRY